MVSRRHDQRGVAPFPRSLRVNQVLREVVAEEIERLADADERLRLVTVTSVDTAPDLRHATVYLSSLTEESAAALDERRVQLQRTVARQIRLKRTPAARVRRSTRPWSPGESGRRGPAPDPRAGSRVGEQTSGASGPGER